MLPTLQDRVMMYDAWQRSVRVTRAPQKCGGSTPVPAQADGGSPPESVTSVEPTPAMAVYEALLWGVPLEMVSVPVLMHCMLEQVGVRMSVCMLVWC